MSTGLARVERDGPDRRIPVLDGLRALAVLAVIMCHVNWAFGGPFIKGWVNGPTATGFGGGGWVGVDLFFVLSGFLITGILYDAKGGAGFFRNFYARRALRILPLYYGFLLFALVVLPQLPFAFCRDLVLSRGDIASLGLFFYNYRVAITGHVLSYFHPFWSLAVEEHFYLVWPVVVWLLPRRPLMRLCVALGVASFLLRVLMVSCGAPPMQAFFMTPSRLDGLLAGSFVALAWRDQADWERVRRNAGRMVLASGGLLLGLALGQRHFIPDVNMERSGALVDGSLVVTVGIVGLAIFFAGLIVLALEAPEGSLGRRLLESKGLCAVGKYSYGIYIFHSLILFMTVALVPPLAQIEPFVAKPLMTVWVLGASFVAAWLSYHLYEKHFLRLKRFFNYREPAKAVAAVGSQTPSCINA